MNFPEYQEQPKVNGEEIDPGMYLRFLIKEKGKQTPDAVIDDLCHFFINEPLLTPETIGRFVRRDVEKHPERYLTC